MAGVDDKIVGMRFDNKGFQDKIAETLQSLDKMRAGLDFANSTRGMQELSAAAGRFSMGNMASQVAGVSAGFVALGTVAITTLANITNRAINAGIAFAKSITVAPIMQGFQEFELKMGSIQTIMSGSGASLEVVNQKLQELNAYSDKTIYSFKDMTSNIGKFTNAGVSLDDSVAAIQGVANVAAISGANSEEASRAMYNFSQALAAGSVKAVDWRSIELANMGTMEFKQQLIDSAEAMGTLTKKGDGWVTSTGTMVTSTKGFRESLTDGWLTAESLTETLGNYSDVTTDIGKRATAAATEVKTFSMMIDTMKESVGSGWATTFENVFGNFEEGKELWTGINDAFGEIVGKSADARNNMLAGWKELGGRTAVIDGFKNAFNALGNVIKPIKEAFRDIFPAMTSERLVKMSESFRDFTERLIIGGSTMTKIKETFRGVFSALEIGWEIIKGIGSLFVDLFSNFSGAGGGILDFTAKIGAMVTRFNDVLVTGGAIKRFFDSIGEMIRNPAEAFEYIKEAIAGLISDFPGLNGITDAASGIAERLGDRFAALAGFMRGVGDAARWVGDRLSGIVGVLETVWGHISTWMGELRDRLSDLWAPSDFDGAVDAVGVGLLGGIALMLKKFFKSGFNLDFLTGGMMEKITGALDGVTGALKTMQADLRAKALMKIAAAMAILTISIVALSLIDSAKLAKALAAIAVGFAQLVGVMMLLEKMSVGTSALKMSGLATGMILIATASTILSIAIKNLSDLSWSELAKGLIGVGVGLGIMITGMNMLTTNTSGMVRAGIGMVAMSVGLLALSYAVKSFSDMSWAEMAKGMVGIGVGLGLMVGAMNLMPVGGMISAGVGMIAISAGLIILAEAVKSFAEISWGEMLKGMVGIGVGLVIIAGAMQLMPLSLPITAAGMVILSAALIVLSQAVKMLGDIPLGELAKGLGALAIMLGILAVAMIAMTGTAAGAAATILAAGALVILTGVLKVLGNMSLSELAMGLGAIAAVLAVLGIAAALLTPVIPSLMALGWALLLIGGAFALFGVGAMLVAKAFEVIAEAGKKGLGVLLDMIEMVITALPELIGAFVAALVELATELLGAMPVLLKAVQAVLAQVLSTVIELVPQIVAALGVIISGFLTLVIELTPQLIEAGWTILMSILQGIRDNIFELVTVGVEILTNLVAGLVANMVLIVDAVVTLITTFIGALTERASELVVAGLGLLVALISGITDNLSQVTDAIARLILTFLAEVVRSTQTIITHGVNMLIWLLSGITDNLVKVTTAVATMITRFIEALGENTKRIITSGLKVLTDMLQGIGDNLNKVVTTVGEVVSEFVTAVGDAANRFITAGADALVDFLDGIGDNINKVLDKGLEVAEEFIQGIADRSVQLARAGLEALVDFLEGLESAIRTNSGRIRTAALGIADAIIDGITGGLSASAAINKVVGAAKDLASKALDGVKGLLGINSPSKAFIKIGQQMAEGMSYALNNDITAKKSAVGLASNVVSAFQETLDRIPASLGDMNEFSPTITPVLDLTKVKMGAKGLEGLMGISAIAPNVSFDRARQISTTAETTGTDAVAPTYNGPAEVTFEQNIYSPSPLTVNDIYRNTKSQIALAKEELKI